MSHTSTSSATLSPDRSGVSTLGRIWTSRHKEQATPLTNAQTARLRMERLQVESSAGEPTDFRYLGAILLAGAFIDYVLYQIAVHACPHIVALMGGR